ncbi:MAG: glycosyltransferase, partial [Bacteriovoracaceae bacterium]|nr:glycosyltransferase [Bacteriovoracaceae bacterium]
GKKPISYFPYWAEDFYQPIKKDSVQLGKKEKNLFKEDELKLVFAGNLGEAQNLNLIVDAVHILQDYPIKLIFVGDGRARPVLENRIKTMNLEEKIIFLGQKPADEMNDYFALADVLYISLREDPIFSITVPSKLQSYLAVRKPILGSLSGEPADLITDSNSGLVSSANNLNGLVENLKKYCAMDHLERQIYAENGYKYFKKHFKRGIVLKKLEQLLNCR